MTERVSIYIDAANLFHAGNTIGERVDYRKLKQYVEADRLLVDLNFYNASTNRPGEINFHNRIRNLGYNLKLVRLREYGCQRQEKKIDTQIVADSLISSLYSSIVVSKLDFWVNLDSYSSLFVLIPLSCTSCNSNSLFNTTKSFFTF